MKYLNIGAATALGIGTGVALAASMGPAGYALGLAIWFGILAARRWRGSI